MRKIKRILLGLVCIALTSLSFLQSNTKSCFDLDLESLLNISQAQAESGGDCIDNGYKNWGDTGGPDGMDCRCVEREGVKNDCD